MTKECSHPNCRALATKSHPRFKGEKGLCDFHYNEIIDASHTINTVSLTCPNDINIRR